MKSISKSKLAWTIPLMGVVFAALTVVQPFHTSALSASNFDRGHIIDDTIFTNSGSMSVQDIQNFLNAKVPTCDSWGTQPFAGTTRAIYSRNNGHPLPLVCLKDYYENPTTHANNLTVTDGQPVGAPAGSISAAQIIYNAAHAYNINPQVLLVTLQKEQGLVTDDWPWTNQYTHATGYGCPDSGGCDTDYYGLYNQVVNTAWQFRQYLNHPNNYNYVVGSNFILYSPQSGCGGSTVNILNQATAVLYDYTPYQPNDGALSGMSDSSPGNTVNCGAYGNRNFWWFFNEWFGSSFAPTYGAVYSSQSAYPTIVQGQTGSVTLAYRNMGNTPWYDTTTASGHGQYPVTLATFNPVNRGSDFYSPSWSSSSRPTTTFTSVYKADGTTLAADQHTVQPGEVASYTFQVTAPRDKAPGTYYEYFLPIREGAPGAGWFMGADTVHMDITVQRAAKAAYTAQSPYPTIVQNNKTAAFFRFKNTGPAAWHDSTNASANSDFPIALTTAALNRSSSFSATWPSSTKVVTSFTKVYEADGTTLAADQHTVQPGQIGEFSFTMTAGMSLAPGTYREYFQLIRDGARDWQIEGSGAYLDVTVQQGKLQGLYSSEGPGINLQHGQTGTFFFNFKNIGNAPWYDDASKTPGILPIHLATTWPINRASAFASPSWSSVSRPNTTFTKVYEADGTTLAADQHTVQPGQIAQFSLTMTAGNSLGLSTYREYFQPIVEGAPGASWDMGTAVWQSVQVTQ